MDNYKNILQVAVTGFLLFFYVFLLNSSEQVSPTVLEILKVAVLISMSVVVVNIVSFILLYIWFGRQTTKQPTKLLKLVLSILLYTICAFIVLYILGQDSTKLFTTSLLYTTILGFALKEPLSNLLSGVFIQIAQPFQIGDRIKLMGLEGVVESINWNSTDIRLDSGELTLIPNSSIINKDVKLITSGLVYRTVEFTTPANSRPHQVMDIAYKAVVNHPNIDLNKPLFVRMKSYGQYKLFYYPNNISEAEVHTDSEILCRIWYALSRFDMGIDYQPTENEYLLQLVSTIEFFKDFSVEAQRLLVQHSKTLLFDDGELLDPQHLLFPAMFLVVTGCLEIDQKLSVANLETITVKPFSRRPKAHSSCKLKPTVVKQVASELAEHIGPVAFSLTYQAAQKITSLYWLYLNLADEIGELDQREAFLRHQPKNPTEQFQAGDFFGEMTLFLGEPLPNVKMITVEETELLAITPASVAIALHHDGISIDTLSQYITEYHDNYLRGTLQEISSRNFTFLPLLSHISEEIKNSPD